MRSLFRLRIQHALKKENLHSRDINFGATLAIFHATFALKHFKVFMCFLEVIKGLQHSKIICFCSESKLVQEHFSNAARSNMGGQGIVTLNATFF